MNRKLKKEQEVANMHLIGCGTDIRNKLAILFQNGVLKDSLRPATRHNSSFEILEFFGDAVLCFFVSKTLMQSRRFFDEHLLSTARTCVVRNSNLAACFDALGLRNLLKTAGGEGQGELFFNNISFKGKADIIEAIIGELAEEKDYSDLIPGPNSSLNTINVRPDSVLKDLLTFIQYKGEESYFKQVSGTDMQARIDNADVDTDIASILMDSVKPPLSKPRRSRLKKNQEDQTGMIMTTYSSGNDVSGSPYESEEEFPELTPEPIDKDRIDTQTKNNTQTNKQYRYALKTTSSVDTPKYDQLRRMTDQYEKQLKSVDKHIAKLMAHY